MICRLKRSSAGWSPARSATGSDESRQAGCCRRIRRWGRPATGLQTCSDRRPFAWFRRPQRCGRDGFPPCVPSSFPARAVCPHATPRPPDRPPGRPCRTWGPPGAARGGAIAPRHLDGAGRRGSLCGFRALSELFPAGAGAAVRRRLPPRAPDRSRPFSRLGDAAGAGTVLPERPGIRCRKAAAARGLQKRPVGVSCRALQPTWGSTDGLDARARRPARDPGGRKSMEPTVLVGPVLARLETLQHGEPM